jgi:uncharacterized protein (DUF111 family)
LRVVTGIIPDHQKSYSTNAIIMVEACIDDMNPEGFGFIMDRLFEDGALDVYWIPVYMKKNRPGTMIQVLCRQSCREAIVNRMFAETTSLGVRYYEVERAELIRDCINVKTTFGTVQVKRIKDLNGGVRIVPEYEACKEIALARNIPFRIVYDTISQEAAGSKMRQA